MGVHLDWAGISGYRCLGAQHGICRRIGLCHQQLSGKNKNGVFWTKVAEPYPPLLCKAVAQRFVSTEVRVKANNLWKLVGLGPDLAMG